MQLISDRSRDWPGLQTSPSTNTERIILEEIITSCRTLFIFNNSVLTAVQSCNISLNGRESMPAFSSTPCRGQSADELLGIRLIWEHLASWSMSFVNFRERFLVRKIMNKNYNIVYSEQYFQVAGALSVVNYKILSVTLTFPYISLWEFWEFLSKLWNGSIISLVV